MTNFKMQDWIEKNPLSVYSKNLESNWISLYLLNQSINSFAEQASPYLRIQRVYLFILYNLLILILLTIYQLLKKLLEIVTVHTSYLRDSLNYFFSKYVLKTYKITF